MWESAVCQESLDKHPVDTPRTRSGDQESAVDISLHSYITLTLSQCRPLGSEAFALIMRVNLQTADTASISLSWYALVVDRAKGRYFHSTSTFCLIYILGAAGSSPTALNGPQQSSHCRPLRLWVCLCPGL